MIDASERLWIQTVTPATDEGGNAGAITIEGSVEYVRADLYEMAETAAQGRAAFLRKANEHIAALEQESARLREAVRDCYTHAQEGLDRGQERDRLECIVIVANEALAGEEE